MSLLLYEPQGVANIACVPHRSERFLTAQADPPRRSLRQLMPTSREQLGIRAYGALK